jgi:hypothetical protein
MASEYERYKQLYVGAPQKIGTELSTNRYILKIDRDSLYMPPVKSFTNGTVEGWTKPLADGTTALLVFNRGFFSNTIAPRTFQANGNQQNEQATAVSLTVPVSFFGFKPGDPATFTQVLADTNITSTTTVTIPCTTNHCTLWIVSNPNPTLLTGDGSGLTNISHLTVNAASGVIGTVTAATGYQEETLYFSSDSTVTSVTVVLPTTTVKGQIYRIHSKSAVTTLSLTGTSFADAVVTSLTAGQTIAYQAYDGAGAYIRIQ